jgi:hypothetical protein
MPEPGAISRRAPVRPRATPLAFGRAENSGAGPYQKQFRPGKVDVLGIATNRRDRAYSVTAMIACRPRRLSVGVRLPWPDTIANRPEASGR